MDNKGAGLFADASALKIHWLEEDFTWLCIHLQPFSFRNGAVRTAKPAAGS
jgi:hypothetical protein